MTDRPLDEPTVFGAARLIADPAERQAYLQRACGGDEALLRRVQRLLDIYDSDPGYLSPEQDVSLIPPSAELPAGDLIGTAIGPYRLVQVLGEGGMGIVFLAEQEVPLRRRVALKLIKPGMDSRQVIARFDAERQALALMDHPHIARVFDAGMSPAGLPYFAMEYIDGVPLTTYCDEQRMTTDERLHLFTRVCEAVQHAHQKGIIHRDLKPTNILVQLTEGKPTPKVIDFGVAKAINQPLAERTAFTMHGQLVGTIDYMSPEQARWDQAAVDTRTDVYSLGVLLYELLTGTTPFEPERLRTVAFDELCRIICNEEPPRPSRRLMQAENLPSVAATRGSNPSHLRRQLERELDWVVMKALEKEQARRYDSVGSLSADVTRYLNHEQVSATPPSWFSSLRKLYRRNRALVAATAVVVTSLTAGVCVATWQAFEARDAATQAKESADEMHAALANEQAAKREITRIAAAERASIQQLLATNGHEAVQRNDLFRALAWYRAAASSSVVESESSACLARRMALTFERCPKLIGYHVEDGSRLSLFRTHVRMSPDATLLATFRGILDIRTESNLFESAEGSVLLTTVFLPSEIRAISYDTRTRARQALMLDRVTGRVLFTTPLPSPNADFAHPFMPEWPAPVTISPDGDLIALGDWKADGEVEFQIRSFRDGSERFHDFRFRSNRAIRFSADSRVLVSNVPFGSAQAIEFPLPNEPPIPQRDHHQVAFIDISANGNWLALLDGGTLRLKDRRNGEFSTTWLMEAPSLNRFNKAALLRISPNGGHVAVALRTGRTIIWRLPEFVVAVMFEMGAEPTALEFSESGKMIAAAARDGVCRVWNLYSHLPASPSLPHDSAIDVVQFSADDSVLLTATSRDFKIWDLASADADGTTELVDMPVTSIPDPEPTYLLSRDNRQVILDTDKNDPRVSPQGAAPFSLPDELFDILAEDVSVKSRSHDARTLLCFAKNSDLCLVRLGDGRIDALETEFQIGVRDAAFNLDDSMFAILSYSVPQKMTVWETATGTPIWRHVFDVPGDSSIARCFFDGEAVVGVAPMGKGVRKRFHQLRDRVDVDDLVLLATSSVTDATGKQRSATRDERMQAWGRLRNH